MPEAVALAPAAETVLPPTDVGAPDAVALPTLADDVSPALRTAIEGLVKRKYRLDLDAADHGAGALMPEWLEDGKVAMAPVPFFLRLFPFAHLWASLGNPMAASVPVAWTLGGSPRWRAATLSEGECAERVAKLTSADCAKGVGALRADYIWLPQLGLVVPQAGKSRVDFFRDLKHPNLPARVTPYSYPLPSRMVMYSVRVHGEPDWWVVLDGRWVERLAAPSWMRQVMTAYGSETRMQWPSSWPPVEAVAASFSIKSPAAPERPEGSAHPAPASPDSAPVHRPTADLEALVQKDAIAQQAVDVTLLELVPVKVNRYYPMAAAAVAAASATVMVLLPDDRVAGQVIAALCTGLGFGFLVAAIVPSLRVRRRVFDSPPPDEIV